VRKLLRTIRFDDSDARVFDLAAEPGEWAVSGAFEFAALAPEAVTGRARQAFANGFLGLASFGRSTFATVGEATDFDLAQVERRLAEHLVTRYGAPTIEAAFPAAGDEIRFVLELTKDSPINTVFTVRRRLDGKGAIREELRTIRPPSGAPQHARIWTVEDDPA
jgi:hypothetical protein